MPLRELERLRAVGRFLKLEISKEKELQEIVNFAADICGVPTALITIIDEDTQHIRFRIGFDRESTSREDAFCSHVISQNDIMVVPDALLDERFVHNPLVLNDPNIRFYAGAPLTTTDGLNLGSLCVIDQTPGQLTQQQIKMLQMLAKQVIQLLEFESSIAILKEQFISAKKSEIELRSFFESSIDCHLLLGRDYEILAFNKSLEKLIQNARGHILKRGEHMGQYVHEDIREALYLNYLKALKGTAVFEQRKLDYDGTPIHWLIKYEPAFNPSGEIIGVSINSSDVTSRVLGEERVAVQSDSLKAIAFIQSHELRRPVASIIGLLQLIKSQPNVQKIEEFQLMEQSIEQLDQMIREINKYTTS